MGGIISSDGSRAVLIDVIHDQDAACYLNDNKKYNQYHDRESGARSLIPGRVVTPSSSSHSSPAVSDMDDSIDQQRRIIGGVTTAKENHHSHLQQHERNHYQYDEEEKCDGYGTSFVYRSGSEEDRHQAHPALTLWCYPPQKKKSRDASANACSPCLKQRHPPAITHLTEESSSSCNVLDTLDCGRKRGIAAHQRNDGSARIGQTTARVNRKLARTHMKRHDGSSRKETTANGWYNTDWWIGEDATDLIIAEPTPAVKVVPLKSHDEKQMEVQINNAEHYDRATWRMYNRITRARLAAQQSHSSLPPMECHLPGGSGKSYAHIDRASILGSKAETNYVDVPADRNERKRSVGSLHDDIFSLDLES
mmetsp:Transcript_24004/g.36994  ORF Transcript_24004/g.36994 Transcript_24004/m.36994 type:complete len:365 (+) Transcript_24004:145-1239(+)|eukprot:CAMPEP_0196814592 /NCGR_PEP_ID=MMETSP1362-20130617/44358_1 /TAXON_ID=163516 /ORGANISM="Leptocylindrus danicus, Strain CCMP1856" /LENGTH=364 /DNA_ID=CAMNT_0042191263 /DNA_START=46 /DNA_END=1140 /DNA_ORIENTATION=+